MSAASVIGTTEWSVHSGATGTPGWCKGCAAGPLLFLGFAAFWYVYGPEELDQLIYAAGEQALIFIESTTADLRAGIRWLWQLLCGLAAVYGGRFVAAAIRECRDWWEVLRGDQEPTRTLVPAVAQRVHYRMAELVASRDLIGRFAVCRRILAAGGQEWDEVLVIAGIPEFREVLAYTSVPDGSAFCWVVLRPVVDQIRLCNGQGPDRTKPGPVVAGEIGWICTPADLAVTWAPSLTDYGALQAEAQVVLSRISEQGLQPEAIFVCGSTAAALPILCRGGENAGALLVTRGGLTPASTALVATGGAPPAGAGALGFPGGIGAGAGAMSLQSLAEELANLRADMHRAPDKSERKKKNP